ncbi:MAG: MlaD family protein [Candidatus Velthaea sp.]
MNRQAIVGGFTILALLGLFAVFAVLANVGTTGRYRIGIHFASASGIHKGALVYESGVNVGVVDGLQLLPEDFTVDVILAINNNVDIPRNARFIIQAPLTGDATLEIVPHAPEPRPSGIAAPTPAPAAVAVLPHQVLPLEQQPQGTNPATLTDLLEQGQGEITRLDALLADLEKREPALLNTFQSALNNANEITITTNQTVQALTKRMSTLADTLQVAITAGSGNVVDLTKQLDTLAHTEGTKADQLLGMLNTTAHSLNDTVDSLRELAKNPQIRHNLLETTRGIAQTATTIASLTGDLRNVTGNPQTQAQLRDTVANVDAASQKANSLLGSLGGTSSVYGVDKGATPAPAGTGAPAPAGGGSGAPPGGPSATGSPGPGNVPATLKSRIGAVARDLVAIQIRISELSTQNRANNSPILTSDRGPQTDFNVIAAPAGRASLHLGANDIGGPSTTYNLMGFSAIGSNTRVGGGILYSRLGAVGSVTSKSGVGFEGRLYDLRRPTFDAYANFRAPHGVTLFGGERDALRAGRRTVFGLQLQF